MSEAVGQFFRDLLSDVKSSRRFQVGAVLWIPLIVCGFILTIHFGIEHTMSDKYHDWRHTFVPESQIQYPDLMMFFANPNGFYPANTVPTCQQIGVPSAPRVSFTSMPCPFPNPIPHGSACYKIPLSQYQSQGEQQFQYSISCFLQFNPDPGMNNIMELHVPGGFDTLPGGWHFDGHPIRPNQFVAVHLEPEVFIPRGSGIIRSWRDHIFYESTQFTSNSQQVYNTTLFFRIPYTVVRVAWEAEMTAWLLLALWGGGFFFFWFLHKIVFSIAKLFLPNDSKLFPASGGSAEYTPLK